MVIATVEPSIQEEILTILPEDYDTSMEIMCQLLANMALSGKEPWGIDDTITRVQVYFVTYGGKLS